MSNEKIKVGITHGDFNGTSYELILKTFADPRMCEICTPVIYGSTKVAGFYKKMVADVETVSFNVVNSASEAGFKKINMIVCIDENMKVDVGKATEFSGHAAVASLAAATRDLKEGKIDVLVTCPINKSNVHGEDFGFVGHTEYLADAFEAEEPLMLMVSDIMRVGLVTIHIPLGEVKQNITTENVLSKIRALKRSMERDFSIPDPRIAVLGLNPHAGDDGLLGSEENEIIIPALQSAKYENILAYGPFAADGFFGSGQYKKFDAILAMYHDQGLAPFKALSFESSVNFTAGLSVVRTSPAHGVGYDIAGKDVAEHSSFRAAIYQAIDIYRNRQVFDEITANPLQSARRDYGRDQGIQDLPQEANED